MYESGLVGMQEIQTEKKTVPYNVRNSPWAFVRPTTVASPEQWQPKRPVSAAGGEQ